jgi:L-ascorbate metabolism protein UlaG (beta-lactamase superfamily)
VERVTPVYLRPNALVEPLFNGWYAWPYLVSPMTAPMYVENLHLRLMESFLSNPQTHVAALRNPEMAGGPFLGHPETSAPAVARLVEETRRASAPLVEFAEAVRGLTKVLAERADGCSLQSIYGAVPEPLRGFVELVYDVNHHPSIRFIEPLLYRSRFYDESAQGVALSLVERDDRAFVFNTPRLAGDGGLRLGVPFRSEALDAIHRMREEPRPIEFAREVLGISESMDGGFERLFTHRPPRPREARAFSGVRVRYFGHACVLVESQETSVLTDPLIAYEHGSGVDRYSWSDLPEKIDYALITHAHQDHCMLETLLALRHRIRNVVVPRNSGGGLADPSLKLALEAAGFRNVYELDELGRIETRDGSITAVPFLGEHGDLNIRSKTTYLVRLLGRSFLFCADSNAFEPAVYDHLRDLLAGLDAVFVGMECDGAPMSWMYGPVLTSPLARRMDQSRRLDASDRERAMAMVERLRPRAAYVYAMGAEPWLTYLTSIHYTERSRPIVESRAFVAACAAEGVPAAVLYGTSEMAFP